MLPQRLINGCWNRGELTEQAAARPKHVWSIWKTLQIDGALATQPCSIWRSAASFVVATWRMNGRFLAELPWLDPAFRCIGVEHLIRAHCASGNGGGGEHSGARSNIH